MRVMITTICAIGLLLASYAYAYYSFGPIHPIKGTIVNNTDAVIHLNYELCSTWRDYPSRFVVTRCTENRQTQDIAPHHILPIDLLGPMIPEVAPESASVMCLYAHNDSAKLIGRTTGGDIIVQSYSQTQGPQLQITPRPSPFMTNCKERSRLFNRL